ncbi:MAG: efflux RND transporter periplasmic adaptor subunit [Desulfobulbaceae bacterium]|nr:efflux RND transporter periplasmic adaptor subunit [Desulfobulbaceae bacterium]
MKKFIVLILVLSALAAYAGYRFIARQTPIQVAVHTIDTGTVESTVANTRAGTIKARYRAKLTPTIGGRIATLNVRKADQVQEGQLLLTLWSDDLQADLKLAQSESTAAEASQREACLRADLADKQAQRQARLRPTRATSESDYDTAQAEAKAKRAGCEAARARQAVAKARVEAANATLERTKLFAPFDGIVAEVNGEIGEYLTPSPPGIPTLPAVDLINMESLYVAAPIDEIDAASIRPAMAVRISLDAYPKQHFNGKVRSISPYVLEVAKQARTVEIEADFDKDSMPPGLLAGYSTDVEVILDTRAEVLRAPAEAILSDAAVYVLDPATGKVRRQQVETGLSNWKFTEIRSGLKAGDVVVTSIERQGLRDGALVQIDASSAGGK